MNMGGENIRYFACEQLHVWRRPLSYIWLRDIATKIADSGNIQRNGIMPKTGTLFFIIVLYLLPASQQIFVFIERSMWFSYSKLCALFRPDSFMRKRSYP